MKSDFTLAFNEIVEARALPKEKVLEALSQALVSAYRRDANVIDSQNVEADIDATGKPRLLVEKEVVPDVINEQTEVAIEEARKIDPHVNEGDMLMVPVTNLSKSFGRIAAQTAKQVILQHIREAERDSLYKEYIEREGELVIGTVQSVSSGTITLELGRAEAIMPQQQRMPTERYKAHEKIRVYVVEVKKTNRGPQIIVSRNHKNMLRRLLEYEVPEIYNGQIEIKNIAREAGYRSKVSVAALQEGIDAVGACVGMRGMRIQNIVKELNDEKIDIIEWDADSSRYIARALSPARVTRVFLEEELDGVRTATVIVPEDQLSLAIGKEGQNARLAAKLTGWRIDIKSVVEAATHAITQIHQPPLSIIKDRYPELVSEAFRILEKKAANRAVTPEEYTKLTQFVEVAEEVLFKQRDASRKERYEAIAMVRPLVPPAAFKMPLSELELAADIMDVIDHLGSVGELWVRFMADEAGLGRMLEDGGAGTDAMDAIRDSLDDLVVPEVIEGEEEPEAAIAEEVLPVGENPPDVAFSEPLREVEEEPVVDEELEADLATLVADAETEQEPDTDDAGSKGKKKADKKVKDRRRALVYDEEIGEVVAKRRRKRTGSAAAAPEDEYDEYF